jgi:hypothetical protein
MDKKDFCGELLAGRRVRGDDGHLPRACGPGDLANPGAGKWRRDHVHYLSPRSGVFLLLSIAAAVAQQNFMTRFCASDCPYARKCPRQRPIWKAAAPAAP